MTCYTTVEIDHSWMPVHGDDKNLLLWAKQMRSALACHQSEKLPRGVERIGERSE